MAEAPVASAGVAAARAVQLECRTRGCVEPHDFGPPTGRGMRCLRSVREGETLLEVPLETAVASQDVKASVAKALGLGPEVDGPAVPEALTSQDFLCLWLLVERARGAESPRASYIASLPAERAEMCAAYWPEEVLAELEGSSALIRLETLRESIAEAYARVAGALGGLGGTAAAFLERDCSEEDYAWARCVLNSRQFGGSWADAKELGVLMPGVEIFNHCCRLPQGQYLRRHEEGGVLQVLAGRDFAEGEEAMITYGRLGSAQMLERGFAVPDNPEDAAELVMTARCSELRCPLLRAAGEQDRCGWEEDFEWRVAPSPEVEEVEARIVLRKSRPLPGPLLELSRCECLSDSAVEQGPPPGCGGVAPWGLACERAVLTQLLHIALAMLGRFPTSQAEDEEALRGLHKEEAGTAAAAQREMAILTRLGEKAAFAAMANAAVLRLLACLEAVEGRGDEPVGGTVWWQYLQARKEELEAGHGRVVGLFQRLQALPLGGPAATLARHAQGCQLCFLWLHGLLEHPLRRALALPEAAEAELLAWAREAAAAGAAAEGPEGYLALYFAKLSMWGRYLLAQFAVAGAFALSDMNTMQMETVSIRNGLSWSVPTAASLALLGRFAPLLEVGCGNGVWAQLLRNRGVDIVCYDTAKGDKRYGDHVEEGGALMGPRCGGVQPGGPEQVALHPERTLVLMWPDYQGEGTFGLECLRQYRGEHLLLVGEWRGQTFGLVHPWGQSFSEEFQALVEADFEEVERCALPRWPLFGDGLALWRRRAAAAAA